MFGRWLKGASEAKETTGAAELERAVRGELPDVDEGTVLVVSAIAGLLGAVAYADREYSPAEEARVIEELERIQGLNTQSARTLASTLRQHILEVATVQTPRYARVLLELGDRDLRFQVLGVLVGLAAVDEEITTIETNGLRQLTTALGLTQSDYNDLQAAHKARLSVLKPI